MSEEKAPKVFVSYSYEPTEPPEEIPAPSEVDGSGNEAAPRKTLRDRLEFVGLILGMIIAVLAILTSILDLPSKWRAFWNDDAPPIVQEKPKPTNYELRFTHALDGSPLAGVEVTIPELNLSATSDEHGVVRFPELSVKPESMLRLRADHAGFEAREQEVTVGLGGMDHWRLEPVDR